MRSRFHFYYFGFIIILFFFFFPFVFCDVYTYDVYVLSVITHVSKQMNILLCLREVNEETEVEIKIRCYPVLISIIV